MNINNMKYVYFLILLTGFLFFSCTNEKESVDQSTFGYEYFPVSSGKVWTYQSDSIIYLSGGAKRDSVRSFIQEEIGDMYTDASGNQIFKIYRSFRRNNSDNWERINTWTVSMDNTSAVRTEENLKFIKLVFPFKKGLRWQGNAFLDPDIYIEAGGENIQAYKNWKSKIEATDLDYNFKGNTIKTVKVNLVSDTSIIDLRKVTEYYGQGIGLVRKEMTILDTDGNNPSQSWELKTKKGFIHTLTLLDVR
ncbi:MAG: hypothetical protein IPL55_01135 [Saprospiraceae bacterium]|nr:hypothetical protein [Saprospiraceae bacterium]